MRRLAFVVALGVALAVVPAAAASPTVRLAIIHVMRGCHVWATADSRPLGAAKTVVLKRGARIEIRINCPMAFDVAQLAGPKLSLGETRWQSGTSHTLVFRKPGLYKLQAVNVQTPAEVGLETMGPDNHPLLTVRVR